MAASKVLAATVSARVFSELLTCFQASGFEAELVHVRDPATLRDFEGDSDVRAVIADMASFPVSDILPRVRDALGGCPVYALFENLDAEAISETIRLGAASFALRSDPAGLVRCLRRQEAPQSPAADGSTLQSSAHILRAFLNESTDSIWVKDRHGVYLLINPAGARFLGKSVEEVIGKNDFEVFPPETAKKIRASDEAVMRGGVTQTIEDLIVNLDGAQRTFQAVKGVFRDERGEIQGVIGTVRDISDRRLAEQELNYYATRLERSNKDLEQFAFIASHDLQAPLRKIRIFAEILQELAGEEGKDTGNRLQRSVLKMQQLISDLLTLSRINRKGQPFQQLNLNEVVAEAMEDLELVLRETKAALTVETLGEIYGDPTQVEQLFQNLLSNSLKYCKPGQTPDIKVKGELLMNGYYQITVRDRGIGFKEQFLERIFRPFERLHGESAYPGTGMGLAICQKIVERHGGQITATSREGEGATFIVYLPSNREISDESLLKSLPEEKSPVGLYSG